MRQIAMVLVGALFVAGGSAHADVDCTRAAKRKARGAADKAMKAKDYKLAIRILDPFAKKCDDSADEAIETAWLVGDLAVAYDAAGDYVDCKRLVEPLVFPKSDISRAGNDKLSSALQYNLDHCKKGFEAQFSALASDTCSFTVADARASVALPPALVPKGASSACLALVPPDGKPRTVGLDDLPEVRCPLVAVISKGNGDRQMKRLLGGAPDDQTFCCGLDQIAVGVKDGRTLVRIGADDWVRECHGGTATSSLDTIYEWKGSALALVIDASNLLW